MLKMLIFIPYGIKKVFSILLGIPAKLFLLIQVLNPLTWVRLSRKINQPATQVDENGEPIDGNDSDELRPEAPNPKLKGAWHLESEHSQKLINRVSIVQKLIIVLLLTTPLLFILTLWNGWGSSTFSTPLLAFNLFILFFMIIIPTYIRLAVVRGQLKYKRLVKINDLKQTELWW